jgi:anhydro-N-acetylmuramic acid kinase
MPETLTVIGLMSGTSMDGIDVALVETDGETLARFGPARTYPYSGRDRRAIAGAIEAARPVTTREECPPPVAEAEDLIVARHAEAVGRFLEETGIDRTAVDLVGFHGQTVLHAPERRLTVQLGDGGALAARLGIPVAWDFRAADVAAGGQGAPLAPVFHKALADHRGLAPPVAFLNVGGVANLTFIGRDGALLAFDTGPGNALLDDWVRSRSGADYDRDGALAEAGRVSAPILERLLAHPFFDAAPPKSLDRNAFASRSWDALSPEDGAATLLAFTVRTICVGLRRLPEPPRRVVVCGGGRRNAALMRSLSEHLAADGASAEPAESLGLDGDAIEAQAFAYLAVRVMTGRPLTFPGTTGAPRPLPGGRVAHPSRTFA